MSNLKDLLARPIDSFKPPVPLPPGTYNGVIKSMSFGETPNDKRTPFIAFIVQLLSAGEDIDEKDLEGIDFATKTVKSTFYLTEQAGHRFLVFAKSCNLEVDNVPLSEIAPQCLNQPVTLLLNNRPDPRDPTILYVDIKEIAGTSN